MPSAAIISRHGVPDGSRDSSGRIGPASGGGKDLMFGRIIRWSGVLHVQFMDAASGNTVVDIL